MMKYQYTMLQNVIEFNWFLKIIKEEGARSFLEVGSKFGGTLWEVARAMPEGSLVVAVDLPHGDTSFKETQPHLEACVDHLKRKGYDAHLFLGDSTDPKIIAKVALLAPFDVVFIDANHTLPFIRQDWRNYGPMGKMVAFHDINHKARPAPSKKMPIDVPIVWEELKQEYRHKEIRLDARDNGIGVLWRM